VNAVASYRNSLDQFKIKLGIPIGERVKLEDKPLDDLEAVPLMPVPLDVDHGLKIAVQRQFRILNAIDRFDDSKRKVKVAANRLRADLNLFADASLESDGPTDYTKFSANNIRASAGLSLDLPLDRLRERNAYRTTLINFESDIRTLALAIDNLRDSIERGLRTLDQRRQSFEIQKSALQLANRRVASATMMLQAGRAEVRDLVEAQDAQIAAQNAVTSALVGYQESRLALMLNLGIVQTDTESFWLKNQLPPELSIPENGAVPASDQILPPEQLF
jgi:outer membrane protein TolC